MPIYNNLLLKIKKLSFLSEKFIYWEISFNNSVKINKIAAFIKIVVFIHVFNILIISFFFLRPRILRGLIYLPLQIYLY